MLPVIRALAQEQATALLPLSVDTFHADVAAAAVEAGATMVNDVSGGALDPRMHRTVGGRAGWGGVGPLWRGAERSPLLLLLPAWDAAGRSAALQPCPARAPHSRRSSRSSWPQSRWRSWGFPTC